MQLMTTEDIAKLLTRLAEKIGRTDAVRSDAHLAAIRDLNAGKPDAAIGILRARQKKCLVSAKAVHPEPDNPHAKKVVADMTEEARIIGLMLDYLSSEHPASPKPHACLEAR